MKLKLLSSRLRAVTGLLLALALTPVMAAPKAELWPRWQAHDDTLKVALAHDSWDQLLGRYVKPGGDGINRVAYGAVTPADRAQLAAYLVKMQAVPISKYNQLEQRAYWINVYNAQTVKLVLDHYPTKSIRDISLGGRLSGLFGGGPWDGKLLKVEGQELSLNDIEHRILRPIWRDPRTHYAVNCASLGCPNLQARAFTGSQLDEMLNKAARDYINSRRGAEIKNGKLLVSSIYVWFKDDFGGSDAGVIEHLKKFATPEFAAALKGVSKISDDRYDWSINDAH